jgi:hypothetical protein
MNLTNDDIVGSKPDLCKFKTNRQSCNPLCPTYKLQTVEYIPPPIPKFIRDNMVDSDIDGAKPKKVKEMAMRDNFNVGDIAGAKPKPVHLRNMVHD